MRDRHFLVPPTLAMPRALRSLSAFACASALAVLVASCSSAPSAIDGDVQVEILGSSLHHLTEAKSLDGSTVRGTVSVHLRANDRISEVRFYLDDEDRMGVPAHIDGEAPYTMELDTTQLTDGPHLLTIATRVTRGVAPVSTHAFVVDNEPDAPVSGDGAGGAEGDDEGDPAVDDGAVDEDAAGSDGDGVDDGGGGDGDDVGDGATDDGGAGIDPNDGEEGEAGGADGHDGGDGGEPIPTDPALPAATLYVSPHGSDANDGRSATSPLRTVRHAATLVGPGDVVYLRGGVYPIDVLFSKSGTSSRPIVWTSYPGEWAVFDGSDQTPITSSHKFRVSGASWNVFLNVEVRHGPQEGIYVENAHDNVFRGIVTHGHQYSGIGNVASDRNLYESITTYDNFDDQNPRGLYGDDADGIALSSGDRNVVRRVLSYGNSDDGIDAWRSTNTLIEGVVAFDNGRGSHGNGNGIKAGGNREWNHTVVRNSIAFANKANGFDDNSGQGILFENNTAYGNGGYSFMGGSTTTRRNNIAVGGTVGMWGAADSHNDWDLGIGDPLFESTDLGSHAFMALSAGSPAIGAGTGGSDLGAIPYATTVADLIGPRTLTAGTEGDTLALR